MRRLLFAIALAGCHSASEPAASIDIDVAIANAARPTTSFMVRNRTDAALTLKVCSGKFGFAATYSAVPTAAVLACPTSFASTTTIAAHDSLAGTAAIDQPGRYVVNIFRAEGGSIHSSAFDVP